jgi:MoaA/NifB/PqqE/SkfB family radical SAM enzyme
MFSERLKRVFYNRLLGYPSSILLQTVSGCNLKCRHCFLSQFGTDIPDGLRGSITLEEFKVRAKRIRPFIRNASYFYFSGFEALIQPDIFRMMDHVLSINPGLHFPIYTNGNSFKDDTIAQLSRFPVPEVVVSLDGVRAETVEAFKTGSSFQRTVQTIGDLSKGLPRAAIKTVFVAHRDNIREFPDYVDFVNSLGVKTVFVTNLLCFSSGLVPLALYRKEENLEASSVFDVAIKRAKKNGQQLHLPAMSPTPLGCQQCLDLFIDIRGNVCPCDYLSVKTSFYLFGEHRRTEPVVFGNILSDDIKKVWFGPAFSSFRSMHKNAHIPESCSCCTDALGMLCSHRKIYK